MSASVAVIVVSWNTQSLLRDCLAALGPERDSGRAEVWVVDNASSDGSAEMVAAEFPHARLLQPEENLGFGPAVNLAAAHSETPWLVAANADIAVEPGALEKLIATAEADPGAGAIAPRLLTPDGATQHSVHCFPTVTLSLSLYSGVGHIVPGLGDRLCLEGSWDPERRRAVDWAHGAFLLFARAAFERVGGFDPEQWMYAEDLDIAWRLRRAGYSCRYEPGAAVRHFGSASTEQAFGDARRRRYMAAGYAWMVRRRGIGVAWGFALVNVLGSSLRYALTVPAAALGSARARRSGALWRAYIPLHREGLRSRARLLESR